MLNGIEILESRTNSDGVKEFDGAFLDFSSAGLCMHLIEAKRRPHEGVAQDEASQKLIEKFKELDWPIECPPRILEFGAELILVLRYDLT
jgi:hypothetical protein